MILGLDLGETSVGWALLRASDGTPDGLVDAGVRVFESAMEGDYDSGRAEPRNAERRLARSRRRLTERRARRMRKLRHILTRAGLLPEMDESDLAAAFASLDKSLMSALPQACDVRDLNREACDRLRHVFHYRLRANALDRKIEPFELGRAIYHLAQRRGFLSNRKSLPKEGEKPGLVKEEIETLKAKMAAVNSRTLGEYFSTKARPYERRIRNWHTSRKMHEEEFEKIWTAQAAYYTDILSDDLKAAIHGAIFYQRPLKSVRGLIGKCRFERGRRRAARANPEFQRFRILQTLANTDVDPEGIIRPLTDDERATLLSILNLETPEALKILTKKGELNLKKAIKLLGLDKTTEFQEQRTGEKHFIANTTYFRLATVFGACWWKLTEDDRNGVVQDVMSIQKPEVLEKRGREVWGLDKEKARELASVRLEQDYASLSTKAIRKLAPLLERGIRYGTAVKEVYPDTFEAGKAVDHLPPVAKVLSDLRNPVVTRVLTETRKVVNAIIAKYGKPDIIRIELARSLKNPAKRRAEITQRNRRNRKAREAAAERIAKEAGIQEPTRHDALKVVLAEECNWTCPYSGRRITMSALLGEHSQFDVEHIIPFSRSLNNSYMNKTLCHREENAFKGNRTPFEAYGSDNERWREILERVKRFKGEARAAKLRIFQTESFADLQDEEGFGEFARRQLNDTAYASRLAREYLALLYGGYADADGRLRVTTSSGHATAYLRNEWGLNAILGDGGEKERGDHRHHAIDAAVVALADAGKIKRLSAAAARAQEAKRYRRFAPMEPPWEDFFDDLKEKVDDIVVSHRVSRRVNGPLHADTFYSRATVDDEGRECVRVRKPLAALSANDVESIVDDAVREAVKLKLWEVGGDPKEVFSNPANLPVAKNGTTVKSVRIWQHVNPFTIGEGPRERRVLTKSNHHIEILEVDDGKGGVKWDAEMVTRFEAMRRLKAGEPIVKKDHGDGKRFVCSLSPGECFKLKTNGDVWCINIVRTISRERGGYVTVEYVTISDARLKKDIKNSKDWKKISPNSMRESGFEKITITPLGEVRRAND